MWKLDGVVVLHVVVDYKSQYLVQIWEANFDTPLLKFDEHTFRHMFDKLLERIFCVSVKFE